MNPQDIDIIVGCEESQAITIEFRKRGFNAFSCDLQPCSGGHPEWHLQMDVHKAIELIKPKAVILHPPCYRLNIRAQYWNKVKNLEKEKQEAIDFFMSCINANVEFIATENPVGIMSSLYRKPDQIIQPYWFGDTESKKTCLWLKGFPKLKPTKIVEPVYHISRTGKKYSFSDKIWDKKLRAKLRSKTFPGIAEAIAAQWGSFLLNGY